MVEKACQSTLYILSEATHKYNPVCSNAHKIATRGYTICVKLKLQFITTFLAFVIVDWVSVVSVNLYDQLTVQVGFNVF